MSKIFIKRGTRSQLNTAAAASGLNQGEIYLITDEDKIAIGLSSNTYQTYVKGDIAISVVSALPGTPDANTLYIVTG